MLPVAIRASGRVGGARGSTDTVVAGLALVLLLAGLPLPTYLLELCHERKQLAI